MATPSSSTTAAPATCWKPYSGTAVKPRQPASGCCSSMPRSAPRCWLFSILSDLFMEPSMLIRPLAVALTALALAACAPQDPQQRTSASLTEGVLLPAYSAWTEADRQLATSAQAFCSDTQDLPTARQALLGAQSAWA